MVPPASHKVSRASWYSGYQSERAPRLPTGLSPSVVGRSSPLGWGCVLLRLVLQPQSVLSRTGWFGLFPVRSPLLRESRLISLRRATEMFQFAHGPPTCLWIRQAVSRHHSGGVAPFGYSGLLARMQLPLNVSPVSASFIGLQRRGIHLVLCLTCSFYVFLCFFSVLSKIEVRIRFSCECAKCTSCRFPGNWRVENSGQPQGIALTVLMKTGPDRPGSASCFHDEPSLERR